MFGLRVPTLGQETLRAAVVHLRHTRAVAEGGEERRRTVEVLVRFRVAAEPLQQVADVVLSARAVWRVARLLEVEAGGRVFEERAVNQVVATFGHAEEL